MTRGRFTRVERVGPDTRDADGGANESAPRYAVFAPESASGREDATSTGFDGPRLGPAAMIPERTCRIVARRWAEWSGRLVVVPVRFVRAPWGLAAGSRISAATEYEPAYVWTPCTSAATLHLNA
jgi:hypothetical protein